MLVPVTTKLFKSIFYPTKKPALQYTDLKPSTLYLVAEVLLLYKIVLFYFTT